MRTHEVKHVLKKLKQFLGPQYPTVFTGFGFNVKECTNKVQCEITDLIRAHEMGSSNTSRYMICTNEKVLQMTTNGVLFIP